ncbi:hypothetical protein [Streptosporangium sp. NPDC002607]
MRIPDAPDAAQAATFAQSHCTAMFALRDRGGLSAGETVLVLGAGGGAGGDRAWRDGPGRGVE